MVTAALVQGPFRATSMARTQLSAKRVAGKHVHACQQQCFATPTCALHSSRPETDQRKVAFLHGAAPAHQHNTCRSPPTSARVAPSLHTRTPMYGNICHVLACLLYTLLLTCCRPDPCLDKYGHSAETPMQTLLREALEFQEIYHADKATEPGEHKLLACSGR